VQFIQKNKFYFPRFGNTRIKFTQLYRLTSGEYYSEIKEDLDNLQSLNINIESITCDGHRSILKAIKLSCKDVIVQRCVVHIERECQIWLTTNPRSTPGCVMGKGMGIGLKMIINKLSVKMSVKIKKALQSIDLQGFNNYSRSPYGAKN
jgi:hypothetical protein